MSMSEEADRRHVAAKKALQAAKAERQREATATGGLLMVHTGKGKGKSTAAFGMVARALGWGMRVGIVQFVKGKWVTGEKLFFDQFPDQVRFAAMGEGFTWNTQDRQRDIAAAERAWALSRDMLSDPDLDLVILDELNIVLRDDYLDLATVLAALQARPRGQHVCVTGRDAKAELIAAADLVTEMTMVAHPIHKGFKVQRGVDF